MGHRRNGFELLPSVFRYARSSWLGELVLGQVVWVLGSSVR